MAVVGYLCGSLASAVIVSRAMKLPDPRRGGSGNPGATNVLRTGNKKAAALTLVGDLLKGIVPVAAAQWVSPDPAVPAVTAVTAVLGHLYPVFFGFKGGKGIATSAGVLLGIAPGAVAVGIACWAATFLATRYVSVASILASIAIPVYAWAARRPGDWLVPVALTLLGVLGIVRHRTNIARLASGTEHRFGFRKKGAP